MDIKENIQIKIKFDVYQIVLILDRSQDGIVLW